MRRSCLTLEVPRPRQTVRAGRGVPWGLLVVGVAQGRGPGGPACSGVQEGPFLLPCPSLRSCPAFLFPFSCLSAPSRKSPKGEPSDLGPGKVAPLGFRSRGCGAVHTQQGPWGSPRRVVAREHVRELRGGLEGSEGLAPGDGGGGSKQASRCPGQKLSGSTRSGGWEAAPWVRQGWEAGRGRCLCRRCFCPVWAVTRPRGLVRWGACVSVSVCPASSAGRCPHGFSLGSLGSRAGLTLRSHGRTDHRPGRAEKLPAPPRPRPAWYEGPLQVP